MRFFAECIWWAILALTTLLLTVRDGNNLLTALVAWVGGIITTRLYIEISGRMGLTHGERKSTSSQVPRS